MATRKRRSKKTTGEQSAREPDPSTRQDPLDEHPSSSGSRWTRLIALPRWILGVVITALIGAIVTSLIGVAFGPVNFPGLLDRLDPNRAHMLVTQQTLPPPAPRALVHGAVAAGPAFSCGTATANPASGAANQTNPSIARDVQQLGGWYALPRRMSSKDTAAMTAAMRRSSDALHTWIYDQGGADVHLTQRRITFQGIDENLVITGMHARVIARGPVLCGGVVLDSLGGAGAPFQATLNLDDPLPSAPEFASKIITLAPGEIAVVDVYASAARYSVTWDLVVDFSVGGHVQEMTIYSKTPHERTTGIAGNPDPDHLLTDADWRKHYESLAWIENQSVDLKP